MRCTYNGRVRNSTEPRCLLPWSSVVKHEQINFLKDNLQQFHALKVMYEVLWWVWFSFLPMKVNDKHMPFFRTEYICSSMKDKCTLSSIAKVHCRLWKHIPMGKNLQFSSVIHTSYRCCLQLKINHLSNLVSLWRGTGAEI